MCNRVKDVLPGPKQAKEVTRGRDPQLGYGVRDVTKKNFRIH
jgi:hypothetical protein